MGKPGQLVALLLGPTHSCAHLEVQGAGTLELWGTEAVGNTPLPRSAPQTSSKGPEQP